MALSPMMEHWQSVKEQYPNCIIFYRLGDFYEMFFEDAVKASAILDLTLTGRDCGLKERAPMCGVPHHAADIYIQKLVEAGERVAVCEQLSDPKASKGMVERDVIRVASAGTVIEGSLLDEKRSNYIACAVLEGERYALAWADITTGEFAATEEESAEKLISDLFNLSIAEIICNDALFFAVKDRPEVDRGALPAFSCYLPWAFQRAQAEKNLLEQMGASSTQALGLEKECCAVIAAGALIEYLKDTQKHALKNINTLKYSDGNRAMKLDPTAVRNLEILKNNAEGKKYGSLLWLLDKTKTGMGARKLANLLTSPLADKEEIERRLDAVEELFNATVVRMGIRDMLSGVRDIERLTGRISNGNLQPNDCLALSSSLSVVPNLKFQLTGFSAPLLGEIARDLVDTKSICALLDSAIDPRATTLKEGGYIKAGYNTRLDELKTVKEHGKALLAELETRERERTGIRTLKVGFNRVFGYYIEVSNSFKDRVPYSYTRKQTLAGGERYINEELKELERKILGSDEEAQRLEEHLFAEILEILTKNIPVLQCVAAAVASLDCFISLAVVAKENKYTRPAILSAGALKIEEGRHPVVEKITKERFVPNDCTLDGGENRTMVITGPNMAGKSTYLRQVALIVFMAHIGSFVPAKRAEIPLTDRIFTRIGASDNLILDRSTFMVEMTEVASILRGATEKSLLILDEVGRGTSTFDGLSIARAVIEHLTEKVRAKTLFATHYHELTELEGKIDGIKNYKINVREIGGSIVFLRKIVRGGASRSFGVEVASLAGVPKEVTDRAKIILKTLEKRETHRPETMEEVEETANAPALNLMEELAGLDVNLLTPMQALALIFEWKEKVK
ncbi:MAG: DNA mismatch repair protein MutS [Clostridia bacterium]|nr:DNA mismatch repair protein MutS [Clostridia bacterium]